MARHKAVYAVMAACAVFCGCETIGAFGTGRMTSSDGAYITHAGTLGKKTTPVDVNSAGADEEYEVLEDAGGRAAAPKRRTTAADSWLQENLW